MSTAADNNEPLLVSELKNHSEKAFRRLFDIYYQDIYGYSFSLLKSKEHAEENVQDVFLKVWLHRENLDIEKSFKAFLFTIAKTRPSTSLAKRPTM
ncbi:RNA polymerase sigma factor [Flavobacterium sp. 3HN19-14]|uniref:RNA polymerase sigma factor n=1 Tax=Flavobacterium sp. 3HN19-14 TaxID=3448133 RepID=UPI003EDF1B41